MNAGCIYNNNEELTEQGIDLSKEKQITRELIDKVNKVNYCHGFEGIDLSKFDLTNLSLEDISNVTFDEKTIWPSAQKLPIGFFPLKLLQTRKKIFPGIKTLHDKGINGFGVNVAYIDQQNKFVFNHVEFKNLKYKYFDYNGGDFDCFHPYGVLSNLCGKDTGVAPNINLYYYSAERWNEYNQSQLECFQDILQKIKSGLKLDVVGISGPLYLKNDKFTEQIDELVKQIESLGCVVIDGYRFLENFICCGLDASLDYSFEHPDYPYWATSADKIKPAFICKGQVIAEWQTNDEYVYQGTNCDSWPIAQCVGLFALCRQINKELSFNDFVLATKNCLMDKSVIDFKKCIKYIMDNEKNIVKLKHNKHNLR